MKKAIIALALTALAGAAQAETVVTADRYLDVATGRYVDHPAIFIDDEGKITSIADARTVRWKSNVKHIDLSGETLIPGLIDMHVHLTSDPRISGYRYLEYTDGFWQVVGVAAAKKTLDAGFTTVRNVGADAYGDVGLKQGIEGGYVPGPRIVPATIALGATGGHCDTSGEFPPSFSRGRSDSWPFQNIADTPDGYRKLVRTIRNFGAEVVKLCATGGVLSKSDAPGAQQMTFEEIKAAVDEAHMLGMKVAAHAHGVEGINAAIRAGVDTIEHASLADATSFKLAKEKGAWFGMDIYNDDYILSEGEKNGVFPESLAKEKIIGRKQRETFRAAVQAGVKMIFSSDAGVYPHGDNAKQFAKMVEWGMTPLQALQAATINSAQALDKVGQVGTIAPGAWGDMVAVKGDPTRDVTVLEKPDAVIKGGERVR